VDPYRLGKIDVATIEPEASIRRAADWLRVVAEAPLGLCTRSHWFWQHDCDASFVARENLIAVEVATIGNGLEFIDAESVLGLASDVCELRSI
jgi:hypothetical protein